MTKLSDKSIHLLQQPLEPHLVKQNQGNDYIPSTYINDQLNRIFGFGQWSGEVLECRVIHENFNAKLKSGADAVEVVAMARVRITLANGAVYEDVNTDNSLMGVRSVAKVFDSALKGAVSGAYTRASRHMGNQFGNVLYQTKEGYYTSQQGDGNRDVDLNGESKEDTHVDEEEPMIDVVDSSITEEQYESLLMLIVRKGYTSDEIWTKMKLTEDTAKMMSVNTMKKIIKKLGAKK